MITASYWFDGQGRLQEDGGVLVTAGRIEAAGPRHALQQQLVADSPAVEHFEGCTLLPGLIDTHTHLTLPGDGTPAWQYSDHPDEILVLTAARNAWQCLQAGFTTVADMGGKGTTTFRLRDAIEQGFVLGPRLYLSGRPLTITGGHGWRLGGETDGEDNLRAAIRQLCKEGADLIKVMITGGGTPGTDTRRPAYSLPEMRVIAEEAHARKRQVFAHSGAIKATSWALEAGFDVILHCHFQTPDGRNDFDPELGRRILDSGVYVNPTLETNRNRGAERVINQLPVEQRQAELDRWQPRYERIAANFGQLYNLGVPLICGSDSGWGYTAFGQNSLELEAMVAAGMSTAEALISATSRAASSLGWSDRVGSLTPGGLADLLVVGGNPMEEIRALRDVRGVWLAGQQVLGRPALS
jgi:imidazolonepropionase-like amidohydrolase